MSPRRAAALDDAGDVGLRDHLIAVTARLIAEHGAAGLTVRRIAREARVADGVLYNHFADKEELLAHALRAHVSAVERTLRQPPPPADVGIEDGLRARIAYALALHAAILPAFAGLLAEPKVLARFAALPGDGTPSVREAIGHYLTIERTAMRRIRWDADIGVAAKVISGACHELVMEHLLHRPGEPLLVPPRFVDDLADMVLRGIRAGAGEGTAGGRRSPREHLGDVADARPPVRADELLDAVLDEIAAAGAPAREG